MTELEELMKCPVNWADLTRGENWFWSLPYLDWIYSIAQHAVDSDDLPYDSDDYRQYDERPEALKSLLINLKHRRPLAEKLYETRGGRLHGLRFMAPTERSKHFIAGTSREQIVQRSKNGPSLFWENYSSARLQDTFWTWFSMNFDIITNYQQYLEFMDSDSREYGSPEAKLWRKFLSQVQLRICMNTLQSIGACEGLSTSFICYELHIDSKIAHCYPVSEAEAAKIMGDCEVLIVDALNC
jgi:hypothetical protein